MADLLRFPVTHHVVGKDDGTHAGQCGAPDLDIGREAFIGGMPVRAEHSRVLFPGLKGTVEVPRDPESGEAFDGDILHRVSVHFTPGMDDGVEAALDDRHLLQLHSFNDSLPDDLSTRLPRLQVGPVRMEFLHHYVGFILGPVRSHAKHGVLGPQRRGKQEKQEGQNRK